VWCFVNGYQVMLMVEHSLCSRRVSGDQHSGSGLECYQSVVENAVIGFFRSHPDGRVVMANPALLRMLGYSSVEEIGTRQSSEDCFNVLHRRPGFLALMQRDGVVAGLETRCTRKDGALIWIRESVRVVRGETGEILFYDGTVEDITVRKQAEVAAQRSCDEKDALYRELQHRVKNSMATIVGLFSMQMDRSAEPEVQVMLQSAGDRVRSIAHLYTMLHASGETHLVHLDEYLERIASTLVRGHMPDPSPVTYDVTAEALVVGARQAIPVGLIANELITNALRHAFPTGGAGHISVLLHQEGGAAVLEVCDDGIGMPAGFDINQPGCIGTELVQMLTDQLGGKLKCETLGKTVIQVVFPLSTT
jgi:PAS domain S-box-containing protein